MFEEETQKKNIWLMKFSGLISFFDFHAQMWWRDCGKKRKNWPEIIRAEEKMKDKKNEYELQQKQ